MTSILPFCIFLPMLSFKLALACLDGECRELSFPSFFFFADKHLVNHTIRIERVPDLDTCEFICYQEPNCVSINFNIKASADGTFSCELNNSTHRRHDDEFVDKLGYLYRGTESACDEDHCHNNALCQSGFTNKKYRCLCPSGFTGERCEIDINECATEQHSCSNDAVCHNTEGSHDCTCRPGYTGDGRNCTDVNECEEGIHNCVTDDECINSNGSYRCTVPVAVALFPLNATYGTQEINNRTAQGIPSNVHLAPGPNGKANGSYEFLGTSDSYIEFHNTAGGPLDVRESITMLCWLHHGSQNGPIFTYKTSGSSWGVHLFVYKGKLYVRFNKRDYSATKTETLIDTTPVAGGWKFVGASYDHVSGEAKLWVDGVVVQNKTVGAGLQLATQDSIRMGVKTGERDYFKGRITQMQVYNESLTQEQIQTIQRRTPRVVDINECEKGTHNCSTDAFCSNTKESFNCTCKTGYVGDGRNCTDVNECEKGTHNCSTDAVCNNTKGSHNCTCKTGYAGDGHNCTDMNECEKGTHDCSINAMCYNTNGSYECTCNPGYTGDGRNCTDINECEDGNNCAGSNNCINLMGSYRCSDTQKDYQLEVSTSPGYFTGTNAPVRIYIGGNKGSYQARLDTDPKRDYFESGAIDVIDLRAYDLGTITDVRVYRAYRWFGSPNWHLKYIKIDDQYFDYNAWVSPSRWIKLSKRQGLDSQGSAIHLSGY